MILQLIKLNYKFLFNKVTISIFAILNCVIIYGFYTAANINEGYHYLDMFREELEIFYFSESFLMIKVITILISILLTTSLSSASANNLNKYIVDKPINKFYVFIAKLSTLYLVMFYCLVIYVFQHVLLIIIFTPYQLELLKILDVMISQYLQIMIYITLTNFLLTVLPTVVLSITPIMIFWYMEINADKDLIINNNFLKKLYDYVPNLVLVENNYVLIGDYVNYTILLIILILGNCLYFVQKDII